MLKPNNGIIAFLAVVLVNASAAINSILPIIFEIFMGPFF